MSIKTRLLKLEEQTAPGVKQYLCIIHPDHEAEGYQVTDFEGGNPQTFATLAELEAFEARPDVDLLTVQIVYASEADQSCRCGN
jgi:hypothetical protein